jgi:hypothetical protein
MNAAKKTDTVSRLVRESRAAQNLPPEVEDDAALRKIADLISAESAATGDSKTARRR